MYLVYFSNIDILALNIDLLPDILKNDILSSYWKRGKYKILYFPRFQYEESIKCSYFSRIQTEAIKQIVTGVVNGLCRMVLGRGARSLMIFLGCRMYNRNFMGGGGEGQGWLMGIAVKDV